ncbi:MAG: helix-turn-helix transcriptional regulator [Treponema sp.]|nr:helix-turn-helix transcriptional regulator [Treponema sp.]
MKDNRVLPAARFFSFLTLLFIILNYFIFMALSYFMPSQQKGLMVGLAPFQFIGIVLGVFLSSVFLSNPWQKKPLSSSIVFILLMILPNVVLRSLGVELFIGSATVYAFVTVFTGMLYPLCSGLFLMAFLPSTREGEVNRSGRFCVFFFGLAVAAGVLARYSFLSLAAVSSASADPAKTIDLLYTIIKWLMACIGVAAIASVILLNKCKDLMPVSELPREQSNSGKTEWPVVFALIGIVIVDRTLSSIMGVRLLSVYFYLNRAPHQYILAAAGTLALCFLAGYSIRSFIRWFLPTAIILFILLPCIALFNDNARFILIINTIIAIFDNVLWAVFPVALIELYRPGRLKSLWFYLFASAIPLANIFLFLGPMANRLIPSGTEYTVWIIGLASAAFILLALVVIKREKAEISIMPVESLENYGFSKREIEVVSLLKEGLNAKKIGEKLFISTYTVNDHIANIYRKLNVNSRGEFMKVMLGRKEK